MFGRTNDMTAEKYVREVGKLLKCRTSKKRAVKRQLLAEINAAAKGESLEEVLKCLGIPWDCANRYNDQFDNTEQKAAKRERRLRIWGIVLVVLVLILVIAYRGLPKWSDISGSKVFSEAEVKAQAEEIIRLYSEDDFETVFLYMNDDMKQMWNAATLQYAKSLVKEDFGELLEFGNMDISQAEQGGKFYAMVQVSVSYSDIGVTYIMTFDENMKLAGFHIKEQQR